MVTVTDATEAFDEAIAAPHLARHHHCLAASPSEILGIPESATAIEACTAFAALAEAYHPERFRPLSLALADRARLALQQLEQALALHLAMLAARPTRRITKLGLPPPRPPGEDAQP